jgi:FixJ family two-component response regulator
MIFIVDDDAATRDSLRQLLEAECFEQREFAGGRPFLDGVCATDGDCLIFDLKEKMHGPQESPSFPGSEIAAKEPPIAVRAEV